MSVGRSIADSGNADDDYAALGSGGNGYSWSPCDKPLEALLHRTLQVWRREAGEGGRSRRAETTFVKKTRAELAALPPAVLLARCREAEARALAAFDQDILIEGLDAMRPEFAADVERWGGASTWSVREAVALYLDRDPDCFRWADVKGHVPGSAVLKECKAFRRQAKDAVRDRELHRRTKPHAFLDWASSRGFAFPVRLVAVVEAYDPDEEPPPRQPAHDIWKDMSVKEQNNVFRLLLALAIYNYGFDPYGAHGRGTTEMSRTMRRLRLNLDHQTISRMLFRLAGEVDSLAVKRCLADRSRGGQGTPKST